MELRCAHLQPHRAFHFGQRGVGIEASTDFAPSDTLFSAICLTLRGMHGTSALEDMLSACTNGQPPFLCGGGFPYIMLGDQPLRFYPSPFSLRRLDTEARARLEGVGKARWLSESLFKSYVESGAVPNFKKLEDVSALVTDQEFKQITKQYQDLQQAQDGHLRLWQVGDVPRVAIDRMTSAANIYRAGLLTFAGNGGLWVGFVELNQEWCEQYLKTILHVLGDDGVGGERSSGYGQFTFREEWWQNQTFPDAMSANQFVTLSYYHPASAEEAEAALGERSAYSLDVRRGWMGTPGASNLRRKSVRMVTIGSVLDTPPNRNILGGLADVTPSDFRAHKVWRNGFALPIGLRGKNG